MHSTQQRLPRLSVRTLPLHLLLNSQMKSFIGTTNTIPARPSGEMGGVEQHSFMQGKGRDAWEEISSVPNHRLIAWQRAATVPLLFFCCAVLQEPVKYVRFSLMLPFSPTTDCRPAELEAAYSPPTDEQLVIQCCHRID